MSFNEYWKAKAAKRRKAWAATDKRFAEKHTQLEEIRKKVYLPLDYDYRFSFEYYKVGHFVEQNPIAEWKQMQFCFSESGLRGALEAEGADLTSFTMQVSRESIVGVEAPCPQNRWEAYSSNMISKVYDNERAHHAWLKRVYGICTDVETVSLTYGEVTMTIKRYSKEGIPFGYYELNPCELLTKAAMMMQETDFNILNVATLLMEIDATWKLRQEELNFYAKKLRLRTMEAAVADDKITISDHRYTLQYRLIPELIDRVNGENWDVNVLTAKEWWREQLEKNVKNFYFDWDEFTMERRRLEGGNQLIIYRFPKPIQVPEALYGVVIVDVVKEKVTYYTLRCAHDGDWGICKRTRTRETCNYDLVDTDDLQNFIDGVMEWYTITSDEEAKPLKNEQ